LEKENMVASVDACGALCMYVSLSVWCEKWFLYVFSLMKECDLRDFFSSFVFVFQFLSVLETNVGHHIPFVCAHNVNYNKNKLAFPVTSYPFFAF